MPSRPVLALVIPAVSCIAYALPFSGGRGPFNHVSRGLETIPNGTAGSFSSQRKRPLGQGATREGTRLFAPCQGVVRCAKPPATCPWNESEPGRDGRAHRGSP